MNFLVTVRRTYRSARSGEVMPALPDGSWARLLEHLAKLDLTVTPFDQDGLSGVTVACAGQRGAAGALTVHGIACRYGALAVIDEASR